MNGILEGLGAEFAGLQTDVHDGDVDKLDMWLDGTVTRLAMTVSMPYDEAGRSLYLSFDSADAEVPVDLLGNDLHTVQVERFTGGVLVLVIYGSMYNMFSIKCATYAVKLIP